MTASAVRLTGRARAAFRDIGQWTDQRFGHQQAARYLEEIAEQIQSLADGRIVGRDCRILVAADLPENLRFTRAGRHFIIYVQTDGEIVVLDFLHQAMDLPGKIAALSARG